MNPHLSNKYSLNSVGREITTKVPIALPGQSISSVSSKLHEFAETSTSINYIYVVDEEKNLHGVLSVKELLRDETHTLIKEIMTKNLVVTHVQVNRKRAAHLAIKHNIKAVPVLDENKKFVGVLTSDKILAILYEEHKKKLYRSAGIIIFPGKFGTILEQGVWHAFISRLPWIIVGLVGGIFAAQIFEIFEGVIEKNLILAAFVPLVVYISSAVGTQTQTFFVRDIAFNPKLDLVPYLIKQFITSSLIGLICWGIVLLLVSLFWNSFFIGLVIGLAIFVAMSLSTIVAIGIPYILTLKKQDPASGSGPFATILQDLISIFIYFLIASALL
ncbi:MAG: hypothetical protein BroJett025_03110 [Patescibacteria group bacterium]|nr:MAG: hypothetical protein BroJett025_03110 [Patescibacteria group bacterium]